MANELWRLPAHQLASMIARREVSSRTVVEAHLARIAAVNPRTNAVTVVLAESALAAADIADAQVVAAQGAGAQAAIGPLHGVPFTIKENIDAVGSATTQGVPALAGAMPSEDAPVVRRMKAAGAIAIARTNMPEMGLRLSTDNPLRGRTLNPWNPLLTAGGSSGGDGAALATGMTPFGLGNDIGGSLRNPAYCCGIVSLKPTAGRIPHASSLPPRDAGMAPQLMAVQGPMARTVEDLRIGLRVLSGRDIRDPDSVDAPIDGPAMDVRRAALITQVPGKPLPESTVAAIRASGKVLAAAGWTVEEVEAPEVERVHEIWGRVLAVDFEVMVPGMRNIIRPALSEILTQLYKRFDPAAMPNLAVHAERNRLVRLWSAFFATYPVLIGPIWCELPWPADDDLDPRTGLDLQLSTMRFVTPANVLGLPAVALTTGMTDGLPTGVQIYADRWREDLCLAAAGIIEAGSTAVTPIDPR